MQELPPLSRELASAGEGPGVRWIGKAGPAGPPEPILPQQHDALICKGVLLVLPVEVTVQKAR